MESLSVRAVAVLGAPDPEMNFIKNLLAQAGVSLHQAMVNGSPVHPGNAYSADSIQPPLPSDAQTILRVECDGPALSGLDQSKIVIIDHHRSGDPGFGKPPEQYFEASSIGQIFKWLGLVNVPQEVLLAAAADHCLAAAYQGRCPGVDPNALMKWRAESRAAFQKRLVSDVLADIDFARAQLREALVGDYADLRNRAIPELPEAAAREGIPFLSTVPDRDGRQKVVLQAAPSELVRRFMNGEIVSGLSNIYGDPERGFAGGYI